MVVSIHLLFFLALVQLLPTFPALKRPPLPPPPTELQKSIGNYDTNPESIRQPIRDLAKITKLIEAKQPKELKDFLTQANCDDKINYYRDNVLQKGQLEKGVESEFYNDNIRYQDAVDLMKVKYSGIISLALVSMIGCPSAQVHAARLRTFHSAIKMEYASNRYRDFFEVLVTVSESGEMHDAFLKFFEPYNLKGVYESKKAEDLGITGDVRNVSFELIKRRRADPQTVVNAQDAAKDLKNEMGDWDNERGSLDSILMETPLEQLPPILAEFQTINDQKSFIDTLAEKFSDDGHKREVYTELARLATGKAVYLADEIHARLNVESDFIEKSFPFANAVTMLGVLSKEDRKKVEEEYQKTFSQNLMEELDRMLPTLDFGEVVTEVLQMYMADMKTT